MKIISKEKAWIGNDINGKFYCFEERNNKYFDSLYNNYEFISEIKVDEYNQIHSFNDEPALIFKGIFNRTVKIWFINGLHKRSNPEKPYKIIKRYAYYFNDGRYMSIQILKENLR